MTTLVPLPVVLPLLGAGAALMLSRRPRAQRYVTISILSAVVVIATVLMVETDRNGPQVLWVGGWASPLGIALVADRLSVLMLLVSAVVTLLVLIYSLGQGMTGDSREAPVSIYHPTFLVLVAGVSNAFLAGDLFNLFVSFEMLLFASYVLLTLGGTAARVRAGTIYVVVNMLSSSLFLIALAAVYAATGSLNFAQLALRLDDVEPGTALMLQLLLLTTFAIKAAVFPLSFWLPDSYPTAPAPVTAVFAGLLTKVGVYAILRVQVLLFPDSPLSNLLLWAALLTMVIGILGAIAQSDIKRMLSFTLVSHIGYMIFGIGLASEAGVSGAIFYVAHHITIQTALFLVVGLIERRTGSTGLIRIGGLAALSPLLAVLFFVPAMNLAGIPPMSGFIGKVGLLQAGIDDGSVMAYVLVAGGVVTSLLTLYAIAKTWSLAFWRTPEQAHEMMRTLPGLEDDLEDQHHAQGMVIHRQHVHVGGTAFGTRELEEAKRVIDTDAPDRDLFQRLADNSLPSRLPMSMVLPTAALIVFSLALTLVAGPLYGFTDRAADDLMERTPYLTAVLGTDGVADELAPEMSTPESVR
ncbi:multicomponent Na+:H+ antiporter subunit D [Nocardioides daedukensis]|uniref:Multicomponent Na+:H+ antiporter subunit D n=1 Tax=Nocardioides daedukensis TaxID=634462 RepID=A0A7Y9S1E1_9ACTN|nr:Na+/H+ antiporter subunit D [Nocardioides daedukensis]NYG59194.1 multicomponent Na+:H+ antiporter subunit D [Nocardioides daedukensis]